ncbi:CBS domain-containing protein [Thiomicrospira microaerophila]|uniref:CBS domain-containing protein n=1 Tax=Thiomicrospira microaerophila TaxID=406020 RepID=UPI00200DD44D|nr:CBS domain-containing protein [Thiomicrospira microaerophila]UQB42278.1 CBS domain-containing protein [Thiomicrospira microaerophila]
MSDKKVLVADVMRTEVVTIKPHATLKEALQLMKTHRLKSLVVEKTSDSDAYGIITNSQILQPILVEEGDIDFLNVFDVYNKPAFSVSSQIDIKYAAKMMLELNIKRVLVTDNNELKGVLSVTDLSDYLLSMVE